ncbi:MAG: protein phosphatase 2C domain-containing protein [Anaerolineae bacterium]|nr:protein phosphatase 2C domain-containing protein [Anaerolineae bacterium]
MTEESPPETPQPAPALTVEERIDRAAPARGAEEAGPEPEAAPPAQVTAPPVEDLLSVLEPGTKVAGRFEIMELLEHGAEANRYSARVLTICPQCGFEDNQPGDEFCRDCGVDLSQAGPHGLRELREAHSPEAIGADPSEGIPHEGRFYLLLPATEMVALPPAEPASPQGMRLSVGYGSDVGMVRDLDEDSLCVFTLTGMYESVAEPSVGLFIVADGMGGHEGGEVASKLAVEIVADQLIRNVLLRRFTEEEQPLGEAVRAHLTQAISQANERVYRLARERANDMGCTLTLALVLDGQAYIANVGDSRTYVYGRGGLRQVTTDHSVVASLIAAGMAEPEELYTHPDRHVVYRAIGGKSAVEADIREEGLVPGDTLLLCCDGLWEAIREEGIEDVLLTHFDPQAACDEMIRRANQAGGEDNISVILVKVGKIAKS